MKTAEPKAKQIPVTEFKAHCTEYLRAIENGEPPIQITRHGKVIALVTLPQPDEPQNVAEWIGSGRATASFSPSYDPHAPAFDEDDWEINKD